MYTEIVQRLKTPEDSHGEAEKASNTSRFIYTRAITRCAQIEIDIAHHDAARCASPCVLSIIVYMYYIEWEC